MGKLGRRPIKSRNTFWAQGAARFLCGLSITPNMISVGSVLFAVGGMACLVLAKSSPGAPLFLGAAACILSRLLCNLLDGMVAVEGGKQSLLGELYNEIPDRLSDVLLIAPLGYLCGGLPYAVELGWIAALLALATAYLRTFAAAQGSVSFAGPMAKSHRMALEVAGLAAASLLGRVVPAGKIFYAVLVVMILGCVATLYRRLHTLVRHMHENARGEAHEK